MENPDPRQEQSEDTPRSSGLAKPKGKGSILLIAALFYLSLLLMAALVFLAVVLRQ
ncbi:MAG TPA: hypothetical protein VH186_14675 [Chloroflexia bacterium]|nr:hypothetical protein [Chloroflexia bacterium]